MHYIKCRYLYKFYKTDFIRKHCCIKQFVRDNFAHWFEIIGLAEIEFMIKKNCLDYATLTGIGDVSICAKYSWMGFKTTAIQMKTNLPPWVNKLSLSETKKTICEC